MYTRSIRFPRLNARLDSRSKYRSGDGIGVSSRGKWRSGRLGPLAGRNFRRFYVGYTTSSLGTAMSAVAIAFAVLQSGGTATSLGVVFAANIIPMIAFMLGGGVIADRVGRRPVMLTADASRCAAQSVLAVALFLGRPHLWLFVAVAFVVGVGNAFFAARPVRSGRAARPARPARQRERAVRHGPARRPGGGARPGRDPDRRRQPGRADRGRCRELRGQRARAGAAQLPRRRPAPARSLLGDLADGWAEFASRSWLWLQTVQFTLFNLLTWGPYLVLGPVLARQYLGGARAWGAVLACYGGGAIIGGLLALGRRPRRPLLVATLTTLGFPLPPLALALHLPAAAVAAGALLAGLGSALGGAIATTVTQQRLPAEVLSRVGSFNMVGAYALGPIAFIAAGPVAAAVGARAVLGFGAAWAVFGTLAVLAAPSVRNLTWPESPPTSALPAAPPPPASVREAD